MNKMKLLAKEDPGLTKKQRLGKAYGICKEKQSSDFVEDFAQIKVYDSIRKFVEDVRIIEPSEEAIDEVMRRNAATELQDIPALTNQETGEQIPGANFEQKLDRPLIPVMSSNVKGVGVYNDELLIQFHDGSGTYRYNFGSNKSANEAFMDITNAGSKGRWVWQELRGHTKGEPVTPNKIGPSYFTGVPTIGGTSASVKPYEVGLRSPMFKVGGHQQFEQTAKRMREYKMAVKETDPTSGEPFTIPELSAYQRSNALQQVRSMLGGLLQKP